MTRAVLLLAILAACAEAQSAPSRLIVFSLDAMSWKAIEDDPVTKPLSTLRGLMAEGSHAAGVRPHYPSTTSNSHAALFTGAWGDTNGITGNSMPVAPRSEHTILDRIPGFESTGLRAEPLWAAAARQGVATAALQTTQTYPFTPLSTGGPSVPLVAVNSYQTETISKALYLHRKDVTDEPCSRGVSGRCFTWMTGPAEMHGVLRGQTITVSSGGHRVEVRYHAAETEPAINRPLARYVSDALPLARHTAVVYFRLFEVAADGSDFFLYQTSARELAVWDHGSDSRKAAERMVREVGGTITLSLDPPLVDPPFDWGEPAWHGGDGTAENRYLEITELAARQSARYAAWLWKNGKPRLLIGYLPIPDEFEHAWKGLYKDARYAALRTRGYQIVERLTASIAALRGPNDNIIFTSDHGMTAVDHEVRIKVALEEAGLGAKAIHLTNCVIINTTDWKDGVVAPGEKASVIAAAEKAIAAIQDPATGEKPVVRFYDSDEDRAKFGFGGANGPDFCIEYRPGWNGYDGGKGGVVFSPEPPRGIHGLMPETPEMKAIMIAAGPSVAKGQVWQGVRSIDLAPLVAKILGIQAPRDAKGESPLR